MATPFDFNQIDINLLNLLNDKDCGEVVNTIDSIMFNDKRGKCIIVSSKVRSIFISFNILDEKDFTIDKPWSFAELLYKEKLDNNKIEKLQELKRQLEYTLL